MSVRTDVVNLMVNVGGNQAQNELNQLRKKAADLSAEMKGLHKNTNEYKQKAAELKVVETNMSSLRKQIGLAALSQKELTAELRKLQAMKGIAIPQSKEFFELEKRIDAVNKRLYEVKNGVFGFQAALSKIKPHVTQFAVMMAGYLGLEFVITQLKNIVTGAGKLADQLADVQRVTGMTSSEVKDLNSELRELNTRTSTSGLREIAIIAGKLGVAKEDIAGFVQAVDMLVVALGDELGDADAITTQLGKILNVFDGQVNGDNITKLGNALVELANAGVASGGFISDFTQRVAGIAKSSNLSLGATLGLAAGFEELGLRSESSATALQKLLTNIAKDIPAAAKIAGVPLAEFNALFADKPEQALIKYAQGLVKNKQSFSEVALSFKDAGEEGARVVQTLQAIGQGGEFLSEKIDIGNKSMKESTAITEAFALKNETLGASLDKVGKKIVSWFTGPALVGGIKNIVEMFGMLIGAIDRTNEKLNGLKAQTDKVAKLEKDIVPLIDRYEQLKNKSSLSKDEQVEMNKAIAAISATIPAAITQFDKYGKAIGLNTIAAKEYVKVQRLILQEKNREAIIEQKILLQRLEAQRADVSGKLSRATKLLQNAPQSKSSQQNLIPSYERAIQGFQKDLASLEERTIGIKGIIDELTGEALQKSLDNIETVTNATVPLIAGTTPEQLQAAEEARKKRKADQEKALKELEALYKELAKLKAELDLVNSSEDYKAYAAIQARYKDLLERAGKHAGAVLQVETLHGQALEQYWQNIRDRDARAQQLALDEKYNRERELIERLEAEAERDQAKRADKSIKEKLAADKAKTDAEENKKRAVIAAAQETQNFLFTLSLAAQANIQRELDQELAAIEKKRQAYDRMLKSRFISQTEYDKRIAGLEQEADERRREFAIKDLRRRKAIGIATAIMDTALGMTRVYKDYPAHIAVFIKGLIAAAGAVQIGIIASEKVPEGRKGLVIQGPSHEGGGIDMVNHNTGRRIANIEGGEPVMVLSKNTYGNNKELIDQLIHNSNYRNGAPVMPAWVRSTPTINPNAIAMMRNGGVASSTSGPEFHAQNQSTQLMSAILMQLEQQSRALQSLPSHLKAYVVLQDIVDTTDLYNTAKRESAIKQDHA